MNSSTHTPNGRPRPSPRPSPRSGNTPRHRPATIAELADRARDDPWDTSKGVKYWLKAGENHRRAGKGYVEVGDLESAFVEYAKAATIVLERLPGHRDYSTILTAEQRHNLGLVSSLPICILVSLGTRWRTGYQSMSIYQSDIHPIKWSCSDNTFILHCSTLLFECLLINLQ